MSYPSFTKIPCLAVLCFISPHETRAQDSTTHWNAGTGDFQTSANWSYGVPGFGGFNTPFFAIRNGSTAQLSGEVSVANGILGEFGAAGTLDILNGGKLSVLRNSGEFGPYGEMWVGDGDSGTIHIASGGELNLVNLLVGLNSGGSGVVAVQGGSLIASDEIHVGDTAGGSLTLSNQGSIASVTTSIGYAAGISGSATVGEGTWTNSGDFHVGRAGSGNLSIEDGGTLSVGGQAYVSYETGSTGSVTVDNGLWSIDEFLTIGRNAAGSVIINAQGTVSAQTIFVSALSSTPDSTLTINGGTVEAGQIAGLSNASVSFTNGTVRFTQENAGYFAGFDDGDVTLGGTSVTFDTQQYHVATCIALDGAARLIKAGGGRLGLSGANTYAGGTFIQAGEILISNSSSIGTGALEMNTSELRSTANVTLSLPSITVNDEQHGTFSTAAGTTMSIEANTIQVGENAMFRVGSPGNTGTVVFKPGSAVAVAEGTGTISVGFGTLRAGNSQLSALSSKVEKVFIVDGATLDFNDQTSGGAVNALFGDGTLNLGSQSSTTLTVRSGEFGGLIQGAGTVVKDGPGTLTLSGNQSSAGGMTVKAGTLLVTGNANNIVVNGGILAGTGAVDDVVTLSGGVLAPGQGGLDTLSAFSLEWTGGVMEFDLGATSGASDHLSLTGAFDGIGSAYQFRFINQGAAIGNTYDLITFQTGSIPVNQFSVANTDGLGGTFAYDNGTLKFTVTTVPEPGTVGLVALALLGAALRMRRIDRLFAAWLR